MTGTDPYAVSAEFLEMLSRPAWRDLAPALTGCLAGMDPAAGPVLDLGAGTGLGTDVVLDAAPDATVLAVEPSAALRAALFTRVLSRPDGPARVTVVPGTFGQVTLPERLGGMIGMHMLGHLSGAQRGELWRGLVARLAPGAPAVVNLQPPAEPVTVPRTEFVTVTVGDRRYVGSGEAEPDGPDSVRWRMKYQTVVADDLVAEAEVRYHWWTISADQLLAELASAGLAAERRDRDLFVIRRDRP